MFNTEERARVLKALRGMAGRKMIDPRNLVVTSMAELTRVSEIENEEDTQLALLQLNASNQIKILLIEGGVGKADSVVVELLDQT